MEIDKDKEPQPNDDPKIPSKELPPHRHKPRPNQDNPLAPTQGI